MPKIYFKAFISLILLYPMACLTAAAQTLQPTPLTNQIVVGSKSAGETSAFLGILKARLSVTGLTLEKFCPQDNIVTRRILRDYGAVFVGNGQYATPCYFRDEQSVQDAQNKFGVASETVGGVKIDLQPAAMADLLKAIDEAKHEGLNITPRGGSIAARRSYAATVGLWNSRIVPGLAYWTKNGKITAEQAKQIRGMEMFAQIVEILNLEERGIFFSKDFSKSILYSVAAPGTSQHNLMLAFDVEQFSNARVRQIMANHGWFQTVASDLPHFSYLGVPESQLLSLGLYPIKVGSQTFWIPQMDAVQNH